MSIHSYRSISTLTAEQKFSLISQEGGCEHVCADPSLAAYLKSSYYAVESGGEKTVLCASCQTVDLNAFEMREVDCTMCHDTVPATEARRWKFHDETYEDEDDGYYCRPCQGTPAFRAMTTRDRREVGSTEDWWDVDHD
ncbi:MAG: hypothetical protein PHN51_11790 [Candidatus Nanopelagicales bacterium]|nr:hypothetical protein [Candidatus Nanopelagicales bacterium]